MDKETLSNYGWIVICTLVLVVMIALSTPFGSYVGSAVKNTTESLFSSSASAMDTVLTEMGAEPVGRPDGIKFETANGTVGGTGSGSGSGTTGGGLEETPTTPTTTGETWILNENTQWTSMPLISNVPLCYGFQSASFSNNGTAYSKLIAADVIESYEEGQKVHFRYVSFGEVMIAKETTGFTIWTDESYRTITLDEPATGDFLTWLQANAVKQ